MSTDPKELCTMRDKYTPDYTTDLKDLKLLMHEYMVTLKTDYGYTPDVINEAYQNVMNTMALTTEKPAISIESVWSMEKDFYKLPSASLSTSISEESDSVQITPSDSKETKVNKLSKFLSTHLPNAELLGIFISNSNQNQEDKKGYPANIYPDSIFSTRNAPQKNVDLSVENAPKI